MPERTRSEPLRTVDETIRRITDGRRGRGRLLLALDFDGTLAPIVPGPDDARILPAAGHALRRLGRRDDTLIAIVSGRGLDDVRARVPGDHIFFAGNHGFEIEGPGVRHRLDEAERLRPALRAASERLRRELSDVEGAEIEDKGVTLSVHYRRVEEETLAERVRQASLREAERSGFRATHGKRVVELRPPVEWDKGRAVDFLIDTLGGPAALFPVFIGDDVTDEDAFRAVRRHGGLGVLVADPAEPRETIADARIESPERLVALLDMLADERLPDRAPAAQAARDRP